MSWFRRRPHPPGSARLHPHHPSPMADELQREIEKNREQLQQHREHTQQEQEKWKTS